MKFGTRKIKEGEWVTLRVLYALLAIHPSAMQIKDISKVIDYLSYRKGIDINSAFAQIQNDNKHEDAYYFLGLKEPKYSFDLADAQDMNRMVYMHDENGMPVGWAKK